MRYLPLQSKDRTEMLQKIGAKSIDDIFLDTTDIQAKSNFDLPDSQDEQSIVSYFKSMAKLNDNASDMACFLGAGYYKYYLPSAVDYIIQRGEFMTAYTPYQPEIAQGTLQYLFEFQTQIARLTGMECANASMWDGATATAEAILMASRINKKTHTLVSGNLHSQYIEVVETYCQPKNITITKTPLQLSGDDLIDEITHKNSDILSSVVIAYPDFLGNIKDFKNLANCCKEKGILLVVTFTNPVALGLLQNPGEMGADIVVGEGQAIGTPLSFGGPGLGLFACKKQHIRQMPGKLVGQTLDKQGKKSFVLTLVAREQHIRREKATSNICTNSGLCALSFSVHLSMLGGLGLRNLAIADHELTVYLYNQLQTTKVKIHNSSFYNELILQLPVNAEQFVDNMLKHNILAGVPLSRFYSDKKYSNLLLVAVTQTTSKLQIDQLVKHIQQTN